MTRLRGVLTFQARSAADDLVSDLAEAGFKPAEPPDTLPIAWEIDPWVRMIMLGDLGR
jgi:hypothetical protein